MSSCQKCGAPITLSLTAVTSCTFCGAQNAPLPKEVEVPVPVQIVQTVVKVEGAASAKELRCPHCGKRLVGVQAEEAMLAGCVGCGGIWLNNDSARSVLAKPRDLFAELARRAGANARGRVVKNSRPTCPECPAVLDRVVTYGIELDVCGDHGTWFDAYELKALVQLLMKDPSELPKQSTKQMTKCTRCDKSMPTDEACLTDIGIMCDGCWRVHQLQQNRAAEAEMGQQQATGGALIGVGGALLGIAAVLLAPKSS